jgi:hypothetical protein
MVQRFRFLGAGLLVLGLLAPFPQGLAQPVSAQAAVPAADGQRLLQLTSIERMLREMPAYLKQGLDQVKAQGAPVPPEVEAALKAAADEVFAFDALQRAAAAHLQASLNAQQMGDWLAFYSTPLGKKLAAADERAASPEFQLLLVERAPQVMETLSRDPSRMALLQSWLQATDAVEQATHMALQSQMALEWGLMSTMPPTMGKPGFEELKNHMNAQRFGVKAQMAQMALVHTAAAYQDFSAEELGLMLQQANSPMGKALYLDFSRQLFQTLVGLAEKLGHVAGRRLAQQPA